MGGWKILGFTLLVLVTILFGVAVGGAIVGGLSRYGSLKPCAILEAEAVAAIDRELGKALRKQPSLAGLEGVARPFIQSAVKSELRKKAFTQIECARIGFRFLTQDPRQVIEDLFPEIESLRELGGSFKRPEKSLKNLGEPLKNRQP